ncbi:DUF4129 domain-containing transglutaminase family protein [Peribacillus kribbensis]|uniref:DUF4129 domain-containing transglutaminase family protein n=1 Tax=Peribacillus kribbensis TaxID=356658 RepID=UPI0004071DEB|nr:DUF4129 domain-containing transglutaminase family protein [Peribacillus kribbensis]
MITSVNKKSFGFFLLYFFGFLVLREWVIPLGQLTNTGNLIIFILFIALSLALKFFGISRKIRYPAAAVYVVFVIHHFYYKTDVLVGPSWVMKFGKSILANIDSLLKRQWFGISDDFKTLLFFVLLYLMTYLITYWLVIRKKMLLFFLATVIYIAILDTFTPYHADHPIIRLVIVGFGILGMQTFYRVVEKEKLSFSIASMTRWMIPLVSLIAFCTLLGFSGPKKSPSWPDPVPYIQSYSNKVTGKETVNTIGYGENDDKLGGAFKADNSVVFRAQASIRHYWKVESKDFYTGKGWVNSSIDSDAASIRLPQNESLYFFTLPNKKKSSFKATVTVNMKYKHIPYPEPLGLTKISTKEAQYFTFDAEKEKVLPKKEDDSSALVNKYTISYDQPRYDVGAMQKINGVPVQSPIDTHYLQLPTNLPGRVRTLAMEITKGKTNWFDKAKAIEDYFDRSEFVYDQQNVPYPKEDQDYVDQFLFETKSGYCDNYSSSMVVLLRSIGIPARWVKGYSDGELVNTGDKQNTYEITNNNAHSWVEVAFPGIGWVPFEPTKGFANTARFEYPNTMSNHVNTPAPKQDERKTQPVKPEVERAEKPAAKTQSLFGGVKEKWAGQKFWWLAGFAVLAAAGWRIYSRRGKWVPKLYLYRYRKSRAAGLDLIYPILLKELNRYGLKRPEGQTLREYAGYVDSFFQTMDMKRLTTVYEKLIYKGDTSISDWGEVHDMWERMMKKTIA